MRRIFIFGCTCLVTGFLYIQTERVLVDDQKSVLEIPILKNKINSLKIEIDVVFMGSLRKNSKDSSKNLEKLLLLEASYLEKLRLLEGSEL